MIPVQTISRSLGGGVFATLWIFAMALLVAAQAEANPRYASIVVDADSGAVLSSDHADAPRYPASLTKMMTLYLLFEALEDGTLTLNETFSVSSHAAAQPPSKLWVQPGDRLSVKEVIPALIIRSANDVAVVVAEGLAGSEPAFAERMTAKARSLGMMSTTFRNASGLPDNGQVSTARDMVTLAMRLKQDFPQYYVHFSRTRFTHRGKTHTGHNRLLSSYPGADGLKTGYIRASGFNVATSAVRDDRRIVSVVMGGLSARSRDAHMSELLDRGFVRASVLTRSDWVAKADVFNAGVAASTAGRGAAATASGDSRPAAAATAMVSQGDAQNDPIRILLARAENGTLRSADAWAVQVGAFRDRVGAQRRATQAAGYLATDLGETRVAVMPSAGDQMMFRAQLVDLQESQARRSCRKLQQQGVDCIVVRAGL